MINELIDYIVCHMRDMLNDHHVPFRYWVDANADLFNSSLTIEKRHLIRFNIHTSLFDDSFKKDYIIYFLTQNILGTHSGINLFYTSDEKYDFDEEIDIYLVSALIDKTLIALIMDEQNMDCFGVRVIQYPHVVKVNECLSIDIYSSITINTLIYPLKEPLIIDRLMRRFDSYRLLLKMTKM